MNSQNAYEWLVEHQRESAVLASFGNLASWDQRTYIPSSGHKHRSVQLATLAKWLHRRATDQKIKENIQAVKNSEMLGDAHCVHAVNIRQWDREYQRQVKIPQRLAVELAEATSAGETLWEQAKKNNDWKSFQSALARIIDLKREEAQAVGYAEEAYDALLDEYEQGATAAKLSPLFDQLKQALPPLIQQSQDNQDDIRPKANFPIESQQKFIHTVLKTIGYDFSAGRLDTSAHPFTVDIGPGDIRLTTRYHPDELQMGLFSSLHEAGHGMYEQGLDPQHWGTPKGTSISLGVHESQSRLWENLVGRRNSFWTYFYPQAQKRFSALAGLTQDDFVKMINRVQPGLIRIESDELTYNLHIIVRFELELALMRDQLQAADLPQAFADKVESLLGVRPHNDSHGVLQDVHWSAGLIGYFPTYTLGNVYAAQLFQAAQTQLGDLDHAFGNGDFKPLLGWLRDRIHSHGSTYVPDELIQRATGLAIDAKYLLEHLQKKSCA